MPGWCACGLDVGVLSGWKMTAATGREIGLNLLDGFKIKYLYYSNFNGLFRLNIQRLLRSKRDIRHNRGPS